MEKKSINTGLYIMLGLIVLGAMMPVTVQKFKSFDNIVSVKGLCEREVMADKAVWPLVFKVGGDDLTQVCREIDSNTATIKAFLAEGGIQDADITVASPKINDKYAQEYADNNRAYRYVAQCVVTVCTKEVEKVIALMNNQLELVSKGIALTSDWENTPSFNFEGLNDIKPDMIQEATRNAREVAQRFADDSGSRLGHIKDAAQGTFSIEDRDSNTPSIKKVRVVTYVSYYLR